MAEIGDWTTYENGDQKVTFKVMDIDGEHLMFNKTQGYCAALCRPATLWEVMGANHYRCQSQKYRLEHDNGKT